MLINYKYLSTFNLILDILLENQWYVRIGRLQIEYLIILINMNIIKQYLISKGWDYDKISALINVRKYFWHINWIKSFYYNFKLLPFRKAIKCPIIIAYNVKFKSKGKFILNTKAYLGQISIGVIKIDMWEDNSSKTFITNFGTICFNGRVKFHPGAEIVTFKNANLIFGNRASIGANTKVICSQSISIGNDTQISWNSQVFDTDFHFLTNIRTNKVYKRKKRILIKDEVFIGNSCSIAKGTVLPQGTVVSCCSKVGGDFTNEGDNLLIIGNPAKVVNKGFKMGNGWFPEIEIEIAKKIGE